MNSGIIIELLAGFALLFGGGELLVRGAVSLARRLKVSPFLIGATVIAFGTSAPELVISLDAALSNSMGIALGNVVGSNIANLFLILGVAAIISPVRTKTGPVARDGFSLILATLLFSGFVVSFKEISEWQGGLMFVLLSFLLIYAYRSERLKKSPIENWAKNRIRDFVSCSQSLEKYASNYLDASHCQNRTDEQSVDVPLNVYVASLFLLSGIVGVVFGADFLVGAAVGIASELGISESVIGLTIVALGSSLPELATTIVAAYRKHSDVALGNVIGSSIFNILGIVGLVSIIQPIIIPGEIASFDIWYMLAGTILAIILVIISNVLTRSMGYFLIIAYASFIALQYFSS